MKNLLLLFSIFLLFSVQAIAQQQQTQATQEAEQASADKETTTAKPVPLFFLQHKKARIELDSVQVKQLDPNSITSIDVIKGTGAVVDWGVRAERGVVIIHVDKATFRRFRKQKVGE